MTLQRTTAIMNLHLDLIKCEQDIVGKANPYHDRKGRFTTAAKMLLGLYDENMNYIDPELIKLQDDLLKVEKSVK